jgi:hypothetical protein
MTFIRLPKEGETVNHIDGNRMNNHIKNLEWLSLADNIRHAFNTGLMPTQKPTYLIEKSTYKILAFRSEAEASRFLHHSQGYISRKTIKGKTDLGNYVLTKIPLIR